MFTSLFVAFLFLHLFPVWVQFTSSWSLSFKSFRKVFGSRFPLPEKIFMSPFLLDGSRAGCQVLDWQLLSVCEDLFAFSLAPVAARSLLCLVNPCSLWLLLRSSLCLWSAALFPCPVSRCIPTPILTSFCLELTVLQPKDVCLSSLLENSFNCRFKCCLFGAAS